MRILLIAILLLSGVGMNAQSAVQKSPYMSCSLEPSGVASFCVSNNKAGAIVVEYNLWGKWVRFDTVCAVAAGIDTCVKAEYQLHAGLNQIRFLIDDGIASTYDVTSSTGKCMNSDTTYACSNQPKNNATEIQLPRKTYFELFSDKGWMVKRGSASSVSKAGLSAGSYKLCYENCTFEFVVQ